LLIKDITINVSKLLNKGEKEIKKIESQINTLKVSNNNRNLLSKLETKLENIYKYKAKGAKIRAKIIDYEEGEKSTKYFHSLEKHKGRQKLWSSIRTSNNEIQTDINSILDEQVLYYKKLFSSESCNLNEAKNLLKNVDSKLDENDNLILDSPISFEECENVLKEMKNGKSPGSDGITAEFYKQYWPVIGSQFLEVINEIYSTNSLCDTQKRGVLTLLHKKGERELLSNWRPITLLNVDYKIIAKVMSSRLKKILPKIIHPDQRAFITGRNIGECVRLTKDIIEYAEESDLEGAIIFLDQEKAFDRVEWE